MANRISRRRLITGSTAALGLVPGFRTFSNATPQATFNEPRYCLNLATIWGDEKKLSLKDQISVASKAGYSGIEVWVRELIRYEEEGGNIADLRKWISDLGLSVENGISFARWIVDDPDERAKGLELFKRESDILARAGGIRIAAPPAGANRTGGLSLSSMAERYRSLIDLGRQFGILPQLEIWGSSQTLSRLSEAIAVVVEAAHPDACVLLDAYHLYRGGSSFESLRLLNGGAMQMFHMNDYPASPPRDQLKDSDRVFPGDGVAPLPRIVRTLLETGFHGVLSLELFNRDYWTEDPNKIATLGLQKMKSVVREAME